MVSGKLSTENSYFRVDISYFSKLQLPIKISKESNNRVKCSQIFFSRIFFHLMCYFSNFPFLIGVEKALQKGNKGKMEESRVRFRICVRPHQVSQRLTQHSGSWSSWKIVQLIFRKNPYYKTQLFVAFKL